MYSVTVERIPFFSPSSISLSLLSSPNEMTMKEREREKEGREVRATDTGKTPRVFYSDGRRA